MTRRCSHCSNNGHNSRTCPARSGTSRGGVVKLFGVKISGGGLMKKSASMGNISNSFSLSASPKNFASWGSPSNDLVLGDGGSAPSGYASDDPNQASCSSSRSERRKGLPWTEEEHRMFLTGLRRLGKGDWRGIARNFVMSRTPTQVASHAQKYFIRQSNLSRRKRRSSLFDMVPDLNIDKAPIPEEDHAPCSITGNPDDPFPTPLQNLYLEREISHPELSSASPNPADVTRDEIQCSSLLPMVPGFYPAYIPTSLSLWPSNADEELAKRASHGLPKNHASVDQLEKISDLRLGDSSVGSSEPSTRSLELAGSSPTPRQPALSQNQDSVVHAL